MASILKCYLCFSVNLLVNNLPICRNCVDIKMKETKCLTCDYEGHLNKDHFCVGCLASMLALSVKYKIINTYRCIFSACMFSTANFNDMQSHLAYMHRLNAEQVFKPKVSTASVPGKFFFNSFFFLVFYFLYNLFLVITLIQTLFITLFHK